MSVSFVNKEYLFSVCGGDLTASEGQIISPNFPYNYLHNRECVWTITVNTGNQISVQFSNFSLESNWRCGYDNLEIR